MVTPVQTAAIFDFMISIGGRTGADINFTGGFYRAGRTEADQQ
jgi:hypothetical protein